MALSTRIAPFAIACTVLATAAVMPAGAAPAVPPRPHIVFLGSDDSAPMLSRGPDGEAVGFVADLMKALGREGGFDVSFDLVKRSERTALFRAGRGDVTAVEPNGELAGETVLLVPLWRVREVAVFLGPRSPGPTELRALHGETVAAVEGSTQLARLRGLPPSQQPAIVAVASVNDAIDRLRMRSVTAVYGSALMLRQAHAYDDQPPLREYEMRSVPYSVAARAEREDLLSTFNAAYLKLTESGEISEIAEDTLFTSAHLDASPLGRTLWLMLVGGLVVVLAFLLWTRSLQRQVHRRTREVEAASQRQALHANILAEVTDAIVMIDAETRVTSWNIGAATLLGIPAAQAIGQAVGSLITNRMAAPRGGDLHEAIASRRNWQGDAEIVRPSGDTRFIETTLRNIGEPGDIRGAIIVARDIDARRRAEIESETRARQQAVVASLGQRALAGVDFQLLIDQATSLAASTLEVAAAGLFQLDNGTTLKLRSGVGWEHARPGHDVPADRATYPSRALYDEALAITLDPRRADCAPLDAFHVHEGMVAGAAVAVPGRSGPYGVLTAGDRRERRFSRDDVHFLQAIANVLGAAFERSLIDADLRAELALHDATIEAVADGILVTDASGSVRRHNQRLLEMWNCPDGLLAATADEWVRWCAERVQEPVEDVAAFAAVAQGESPQSATLTLKDGRVIERHSQPQRVDGRIDGRVWCFRDVTGRVRAEEERRRLEGQMQHVQKLESLGVLAGGIAHDFNNLLVGMLGHAGLALQELEPDSPGHDSVVQIQTTAQRAAELTNQMLAYSGKGKFVLQSIDLSDMVGEMTHLLRTAVAKSAEIVLDLDHDLPAFDGDPAQIRQVIMNLITNASDAIGSASGCITVNTGQTEVRRADVVDAWVGDNVKEGTYVYAEVSDTGCGMDKATLARIFDPFFTTKFTGRGLGLAAVLGIVRGHHGAIKIASTPGRGTTFRVLLPATRRPATVEAVAVKATPAHAEGARVMVVDDEAGVRTIARESLRRAGFDVTTANDGADAVALLAQGAEFDAVLLDLTMPRMDGVETFRRIKESRPSLPVVLTSGYSAQEAFARFGSDGIAGFIQKPFMPAALVRTMLDAVGQRKVA